MSGWRLRIAPALTLMATLSLIAGCATSAARGVSTGVVGETYFPNGHRDDAPAVSARTLAGPTFALADARGRVIVVNVWASWCVECRKESRGLGRLSAALSEVSFVGIDEHDVDDKARAFAEASGTTYPQLVDPRGTLLRRLTPLPSLGIPSTLVIDPNGRMAGRIIGAADETVLRKLIERVANDR